MLYGYSYGSDISILLLCDGPEIKPLLEKLCKSPSINKIYVPINSYFYPHNHKKIEYIYLSSHNIYSITEFAIQKNITLMIINHSDALKNGLCNLANYLFLNNFGPSKEILFLENSYEEAHQYMRDCKIPTPSYIVCTSEKDAIPILYYHDYPLIIKNTSYNHQKSYIFKTKKEVLEWVHDWFKENTTYLIIEEYIDGEIVELMILTDGLTIVPLLYCNKKTLNTHNFLYEKPLFFKNHNEKEMIITTIVDPLLKNLKNKSGYNYKGILNISCIIKNEIAIPINISCGFKNPQTNYLLHHIKTDFFKILQDTLEEKLHNIKLEWDDRSNIDIILDEIIEKNL